MAHARGNCSLWEQRAQEHSGQWCGWKWRMNAVTVRCGSGVPKITTIICKKPTNQLLLYAATTPGGEDESLEREKDRDEAGCWTLKKRHSERSVVESSSSSSASAIFHPRDDIPSWFQLAASSILLMQWAAKAQAGNGKRFAVRLRWVRRET